MLQNVGGLGNNWRAELEALKEQEEYAGFMEKLAELLPEHASEVDADLMYDGAFAYFMLGDYERATSWVDNCLSMDSGHIKARILLGRICILEERTEDALALFELVLDKGKGQISEDEIDDIATISSYYARRDVEHTKEAFPHLAVLLELLPQEALAQKQENLSFIMEETDTVEQLDVMKAAEESLSKILSQKISLRDKVHLLEVTAGGFFTEGGLEAAEHILAAALALDPLDNNLLRNMALVQKEMGHDDKAMRFASQMSHMDFLLLHLIRN